jgi:hypothetical protein
MWIFRAERILDRVRPKRLEHLVGTAAEQERVSLSHVAKVGLGELFVRHDPVELAAFGGKVAVGTDVV